MNESKKNLHKEVCNFVEKLGGKKVYLLNAKFVFLLLSAVKRVIANLLNSQVIIWAYFSKPRDMRSEKDGSAGKLSIISGKSEAALPPTGGRMRQGKLGLSWASLNAGVAALTLPWRQRQGQLASSCDGAQPAQPVYCTALVFSPVFLTLMMRGKMDVSVFT